MSAEDGQDWEGGEEDEIRKKHACIGELLRPDACRSRRSFSCTDPFSLSEGLVGLDRLRHLRSLRSCSRGFHRAPQWRAKKIKRRRRTWEENPPKWGSVSLCVAWVSVHVGVLETKPKHISMWWGFPRNIDSRVLLLSEQTDQYKVCLRRGSSHLLCMSWQYDKYLETPRGESHLLYWLAQRVNVNS